MKPQHDVNDNGQSKYIEPSHSYKELDNTGNENPAIKRKNNTSMKSTINIFLLVILFLLLIFTLAFFTKGNDTKKLDEEKFFSSNTTEINTYDVSIKVTNYMVENNEAKIDVEICNNSDENVYITAKGIYLTSQDSVYCTNVIKSSLHSKFYGQAILPNETIKATLVYEDIVDEPTNLVFTNIVDTKHLSWTNSISLK